MVVALTATAFGPHRAEQKACQGRGARAGLEFVRLPRSLLIHQVVNKLAGFFVIVINFINNRSDRYWYRSIAENPMVQVQHTYDV